MGRLHRAVTAVGAVVVIAVVGTGPLRTGADAAIQPEGQTVHLLRGSITGTVIDDAAARSPAWWSRPSARRWR